MARTRSQKNAYVGISETTNDGVRIEPQNNRPGTSKTANDGLETVPNNNQPEGSGSAIKKPWPSAQNAERFLDTVKCQQSTFEDDDVDENEDIEPSSETSMHSMRKSYTGKRVRSDEDNSEVVLAKRRKERDANHQRLRKKLLNQRDGHVDSFFKSIAKTVKKFPKKAISKAKRKVLNLILKLEKKYDPDIPPTLITPTLIPPYLTPFFLPRLPPLLTPMSLQNKPS